MPQEFQVLRCCQCSTFQVHQVKKAKKWNCKMCGEKQSIIKVFGRGTAADCRHHVQKLNTLRGEVEQASLEISPDPVDQTEISHQQSNDFKDGSTTGDRWSKFVTSDLAEDDDEDGEIDERFTTDMAELRQKQRARKRKRNQREYEDESSQQSQLVHRSNQNPDRRSWCTRRNNSPEMSYRDVTGSEIKENFGNLGNFEGESSSQEYFENSLPRKSLYAMKSVYSFKDLNKGQAQFLEQDGSVKSQDVGYYGNQSNVLFSDRQGLTASKGQGNYQSVNRSQIQNKSNTDSQVQDKGQNEDQGLQQFLNQRKSFDESHSQSVITNQETSKWSKYEDDSDSSETTDAFINRSVNMHEKVQNYDEDNDGTLSLQSTAMNNQCTRTHQDAGSSSAKLITRDGENLGQNQHKVGTGMAFSLRGHVLESNDFEQYSNRQMGDNSYSTNQRQYICESFVKGQENKANVRTALPVSNRTALPVSNRTALPVSNRTALPVSNRTALPVSNRNHGRVNSVPLASHSTATKSMFVTEDITDEDLML